VSLLPSTILAMNRVVETMGGKGKRSLWVEKVILRALEEDWDIVIVQPVKPPLTRKRQPKYEPSQAEKDAWQQKLQLLRDKDE